MVEANNFQVITLITKMSLPCFSMAQPSNEFPPEAVVDRTGCILDPRHPRAVLPTH